MFRRQIGTTKFWKKIIGLQYISPSRKVVIFLVLTRTVGSPTVGFPKTLYVYLDIFLYRDLFSDYSQ